MVSKLKRKENGRIVVEAGLDRKNKFREKCVSLNSDMTKQLLVFIDSFLRKKRK